MSKTLAALSAAIFVSACQQTLDKQMEQPQKTAAPVVHHAIEGTENGLRTTFKIDTSGCKAVEEEDRFGNTRMRWAKDAEGNCVDPDSVPWAMY